MRERSAVGTATAVSVAFLAVSVALLHAGSWVSHRVSYSRRTPTCDEMVGRFLTHSERMMWDRLGCSAAHEVSLQEIREAVGRRRLIAGATPTRAMSSGDVTTTGVHQLPPQTSPLFAEEAQHPGPADDGATPSTPEPSEKEGHSVPVIAVCLASTTRGLLSDDLRPAKPKPGHKPIITLLKGSQSSVDIASLPLGRLLRSVAATAEVGFEYRVYVVYDDGDSVYDYRSATGGAGLAIARDGTLLSWFDSHVGLPLAKRGIRASLVLIPFVNRLSKPGPAFNVATQSAYDDGADYLYRVNDDTEFVTPWASAFVKALQTSSPPNLGVVGPSCSSGNRLILTHDFTHRTHLDIFDTYYPTSLTGWYMDDWMTRVYGGLNSRRSRVLHDVEVRHRADPVRRRYSVSPHTRRLLNSEVLTGLDTVISFVKKQTAARTSLSVMLAEASALQSGYTPDSTRLVRSLDPSSGAVVTTVLSPAKTAPFATGGQWGNGPVGSSRGDGQQDAWFGPAKAHSTGMTVSPPPSATKKEQFPRAAIPFRWNNRFHDDTFQPDHDPWLEALEDFTVIHRIAAVRRQQCAVSGTC